MFVYGGDSKTYDVDISIIQYMTFTLPHQQIFIDISNFVIFFYQCREPSLVSCLLSLVSVSCLLSPVSCLMSPVSCLTSPMLYCKCCRFNLGRYSGFSDFMEQICGLGQFSNLNPLSGFRGLKANFFLADMKFSRHRHS